MTDREAVEEMYRKGLVRPVVHPPACACAGTGGLAAEDAAGRTVRVPCPGPPPDDRAERELAAAFLRRAIGGRP